MCESITYIQNRTVHFERLEKDRALTTSDAVDDGHGVPGMDDKAAGSFGSLLIDLVKSSDFCRLRLFERQK